MNERLKSLFQQKKILFGGDYNPEQWLDRPDILAEDIRLMKKAHVNVATLGVFSWSMLEPEEGNYQFDWLKQIMDNLYQNGIYTVLATPSGARPVWLDEQYPEVLRVDEHEQRHKHGWRHNHCMSSPIYRDKVGAMDRKLAETFGSHPGLLLWHISNEFGGECYCPLCQKRFQNYLADRFDHDIDKLNAAWWTTFWSHKYQRFDQIEPPFAHGETSNMGLLLEWRRFTTWNMTDYMKSEIAIFRELTPNVGVTTNFMTIYDGLDYRVMEKELDIVSWDSYPMYHNDYEAPIDTALNNTFNHVLYRSMKKGQPFMMMESTPGLVNWHPYNKLQRPGIHTLMNLQAISTGADTAMHFQWRKGRGSYEQYHGAVIDHLGSDDTRIFREVTATGELLDRLSPVMGSLPRAKAALLFDWDTRWAIRDMRALGQESKQYEETCMEQFRILNKLGIETDIISRKDTDRFADYKMIVAPMMYIVEQTTADALRTFVENGGQLLATYLCGYVDPDTLCHLGGFPGCGLKDLFGVITTEIDTLYPTDRTCLASMPDSEIRDYAELLRVADADVVAEYGADFYRNTPAVTIKKTGQGTATYVAARLDAATMASLYGKCMQDAGETLLPLPEGIEHHVRYSGDTAYHFFLNHNDSPVAIDLTGYELEQAQILVGTEPADNKLTLEGRGYCVLVIS